MAELNELPLIGCMELTVSESWTELSEVFTEVLSELKLPDSYRVKQCHVTACTGSVESTEVGRQNRFRDCFVSSTCSQSFPLLTT